MSELSTDEVRTDWAIANTETGVDDPRPVFDEWLARVKADAWDEGHYRGFRDGALDLEPADNPYRWPWGLAPAE
jgi:hypothetical protein